MEKYSHQAPAFRCLGPDGTGLWRRRECGPPSGRRRYSSGEAITLAAACVLAALSSTPARSQDKPLNVELCRAAGPDCPRPIPVVASAGPDAAADRLDTRKFRTNNSLPGWTGGQDLTVTQVGGLLFLAPGLRL